MFVLIFNGDWMILISVWQNKGYETGTYLLQNKTVIMDMGQIFIGGERLCDRHLLQDRAMSLVRHVFFFKIRTT